MPLLLDDVDSIGNYAAGAMSIHQTKGEGEHSGIICIVSTATGSSACSVLDVQRKGFLPVIISAADMLTHP